MSSMWKALDNPEALNYTEVGYVLSQQGHVRKVKATEPQGLSGRYRVLESGRHVPHSEWYTTPDEAHAAASGKIRDMEKRMVSLTKRIATHKRNLSSSIGELK